jgi:hypothetical protein
MSACGGEGGVEHRRNCETANRYFFIYVFISLVFINFSLCIYLIVFVNEFIFSFTKKKRN